MAHMGVRSRRTDHISELPDFILHHILSYLDTKEAARTSIISKRWRFVWETFPILDGCQHYFKRNENAKFMSYVDKKLHQFREEKLKLNKFRLDISCMSNDLALRARTWMESADDMGVQVLDLLVYDEHLIYEPHNMSDILLTMKSLTAMNLQGYVLFSSSSLNRNAIKLSSLVELHLQGVYIDEGTIQDLVFCCRSMKDLFLMSCLGFYNLDIHNHDNLENVIYRSHEEFKLRRFSISVPTLENLEIGIFGEDNWTCEMIVSSVCENLKSLCFIGITIDSEWLQSRLTSNPLLERLYLGRCRLQNAIKLSSEAIKEITINYCTNLEEAEFDTPNLRSFSYHGMTMPRLCSNSVAAYRRAELLLCAEDMDTSFFLTLYNFVRDHKFQDLTLKIDTDIFSQSTEKAISFDPAVYMETEFPPYEFNLLKFDACALFASSVNFEALCDGLFWNLRPRNLCLQLTYFCSYRVVKGLLYGLVAKDGSNEGWHRSLKDMKLINDDAKVLKKNSVLNARTVHKFTRFVDDWESEGYRGPFVMQPKVPRVEALSFQMSWL